MRKIFMVGASAAASVLLMTGCNKQVIDLTYEYSQAQIKMPDGTVIEGKVDSWNDYEGDQLQVKINGTTYVYAPNFTIYGSMNAEDLRSVMDEGYEKFCEYVERYEREKRRTQYGT